MRRRRLGGWRTVHAGFQLETRGNSMKLGKYKCSGQFTRMFSPRAGCAGRYLNVVFRLEVFEESRHFLRGLSGDRALGTMVDKQRVLFSVLALGTVSAS